MQMLIFKSYLEMDDVQIFKYRLLRLAMVKKLRKSYLALLNSPTKPDSF